MSDGQFQIPGKIDWENDPFFQLCPSDKLKSMTGIEKIAQERLEQKTKHRHSIKSDWQQYPDYQLAILAEALLSNNWDMALDEFPRDLISKLSAKSYEKRLVIAGALIAAEIDRLNFEE